MRMNTHPKELSMANAKAWSKMMLMYQGSTEQIGIEAFDSLIENAAREILCSAIESLMREEVKA